MTTLVSILTNAIFITLATIILRHYLSKNLQKDLEKLKSDLQIEQNSTQEILNKKRTVYIELVESMSIFIGNRIPDQEQEIYKKRFLNAYDTSWLWASDTVLKALSNYMALKHNPSTEEEEKLAFANLVMEMRKDLNFTSSAISVEDYKFISF